MRKIHMLWILIALTGCQKYADFPSLSTAEGRRLSATLPFMQVAYGDTTINYYNIETIVQAGDTNAARHFITIYGLDQFYSIAITIPGDSIPTGTFSLDARHSSVSILQYGRLEIAQLCPFCTFDLSVDGGVSGGVAGLFSGSLKNPSNGRILPVQGSFINVRSN